LVLLTLLILKWKALLDFLLPPQTRYQLAFRPQDQASEATWNAIDSIEDLVTLRPQYQQSMSAVFLKLGTHDSMVNFLTNSLTEASTMAGKSGPLSYNFCKNLIQIKQKKMLPATLVDTFLRPSYISRNKFFDTAFNNVLESCKAFKKAVEMLDSSCAAPLEDLAPYMDATTECINVEKFLIDFKLQMDSNFKLLDSLDPLSRCRAHLNFLTTVLGDTFDESTAELFGKEQPHFDKPKMKKILFAELKDLMDLLMDLSENLQSQIIFCTDSLPDIQLDCFTHPKIFTYFQEHKDTFKQFFDNHITFPATLINITQLATTTIQIKNDAELARVKSQYDQFLTLYNRVIKMTPTQWPTKLKNLSTSTGWPLLPVASVKDFYATLTSYAEYTKRLELTKKNWSLGLRVIFGAMAVMSKENEPAVNRTQ